MADTLTGLFIDIADAIRYKTKSTEQINAQNFADEINNIEFETEVCTIVSDHYEEILPPEGKYFSKVIKIPNYLCFTAEEADSTIGLESKNSTATLQYSIDKQNWTDINTSTTINLDNVGDKVYFKGRETSASNSNYTKFKMTGKIAASGSIMSILTHDDSTNTWDDTSIPCNYACYRMFHKCTLTSTPELPATTLAMYCYSRMFGSCYGLTTLPSNLLPATTLDRACYEYMFQSCSSLTTTPKLPATTLPYGCYQYMFSYCNSLITLPNLPATNINQSYCYQYMFFMSSNIKLSTEQTGEYQTPYRIPTSGTGTLGRNDAIEGMFSETGVHLLEHRQ